MRRWLVLSLLLSSCGEASFVEFEERVLEEEEPLTPTFRGGVLKILRKTDSRHMCSTDCHIGANPTRELAFDGTDPEVYDELFKNRLSGQAVNTIDPPASPLLLLPLSGEPNHPKEPWESTNDEEYQIIRAWIADGAVFN